jgi:hypothetical protein
MDNEQAWRAARYLSDAADRATRAADRLEEVCHKLTHLFEDGYGGNALRLIELMESKSIEPQPKLEIRLPKPKGVKYKITPHEHFRMSEEGFVFLYTEKEVKEIIEAQGFTVI